MGELHRRTHYTGVHFPELGLLGEPLGNTPLPLNSCDAQRLDTFFETYRQVLLGSPLCKFIAAHRAVCLPRGQSQSTYALGLFDSDTLEERIVNILSTTKKSRKWRRSLRLQAVFLVGA